MDSCFVKPLALAVSALSMVSSIAQENEVESDSSNKDQSLETVVVSATRYQQDIDKIPGSVTVISQQELQTQLSFNDDLTSVLGKLVPGMTPSRQKLSNQGENLRGRTALILVDGVPQNNPLRNGNRYGYPLDSSMVERIEVVSGASAVHGMGATGGLINYKTLSATEGDDGRQTLGLRISDSFLNDGLSTKGWYQLREFNDDYDLVFATSWQAQGLYYDAKGNAIGMNSVQGETQDSVAKDYFLKMGTNFNDQRLEFLINRFQLHSNHDYVPISGDHKNKIPGTVALGTPTGEPINNEVNLYSLTYSHLALAGGTFTAQLFYQDFEGVYGESNWWATPEIERDQGAIVSTKPGIKLAYTQVDLFGRNDHWVVGLDLIEDETQQLLKQTGLGVTPLLSSLSLAPFVQGDMLITNRLRLSGGLRYENIRVKAKDGQTLYGYGLLGNDGSEYGQIDIIGGTQKFDELIVNLGTVYNLTDRINVTGGYNQSFGLPDIGRILRGKYVGGKAILDADAPNIDFNLMPAVEPVATDNYEIGINYTDAKWSLAASTYYSVAKDGANLSPNQGGTFDVARQRTEIRGTEFVANYQLSEQLQIQALYSRVHGEVDSDGSGRVDSDIDLKNLSPDRIMIGADYHYNDAIIARLQVNHLKSRHNVDVAEGQFFKGYTLFDATVAYNMRDYGRLSFAVENLTDEFYINYFSQIRNANAYYFSGRGRTFSLDYQISF